MTTIVNVRDDLEPVRLIGTKAWKQRVPPYLQSPLAKALHAMEENNIGEACQWFGKCMELIPPEEYTIHGRPVMFFGSQVATQAYFSRRGVADTVGKETLMQWREMAETINRGAVEIFPEDAVPVHNLGRFLQDDHRDAEAVSCYQQAVALDPNRTESWGNLGTALYQLGEVEAGWAAWRHCLNTKPEVPSGWMSQAYIHFREGRWEDGWACFAHRWKDIEFQRGYGRKDLKGIRWDGTGLRKRDRLLLHGEQGLGDHVQFARYARRAKDDGYPIVGIETRKTLKRWMERAFPDIPIYARDEDALPEFSHHCSLMDLPHLTGWEIPDPVPPPNVEPRRLVTDGTKAIGLAWEGAKGNPADEIRSIPQEMLVHLADIPGVTWVSLQFAEDANIVGRSWLGKRFVDGTAGCTDVLDTASVMQGLDHVICVDTLTGHLAGTLGVPTTILHRFCREWRWLDAGTTAPWYPSVRSLTVPAPNDWAALLQQVRKELGG